MRRATPLALAAALAVVVAACSDQQPTSSVTSRTPEQAAPLISAPQGQGIDGQYIVVLKDDAEPRTVAESNRLAPSFIYERALRGFAVRLTPPKLEVLRNDPRVEYIEEDQVVSATTTQSNATWGLDRVDQRDLPLNTTYIYTPTGAGVRAYIIDTGIYTSHSQFGGRASIGYDALGGSGQDCHGHGTHVAGTVGGSTYGVAKGVTLIGVRVLDCSGNGTNSGVIAGMDWVTNNRVLPAVANMSVGGGFSQAVNDAAARMTNAGVSLSVAAGNESQNACNTSPASAASAITVGSTTSSDARSSFSNYGSCLDIFAPGSNITSAGISSTTSTASMSGTSMASPHVAGVAALYLQGNPSASAATVANAIINSATTGKVTSPGTGSPNRLVYSLLTPPSGGGGGGAPCTGCTLYTGSLSGTGAAAVQPNGNYYQSTVSGTHRGWLRGPTSGADFDLYLYKWNGSAWVVVASAESATSSEDITYSGTAGYYYWRILSYSGSGAYNFYLTKP
jgi:subtilisin family serine protease